MYFTDSQNPRTDSATDPPGYPTCTNTHSLTSLSFRTDFILGLKQPSVVTARMPSQDFIDVRIYVDGQPLVEYLNSDGENGADQQMTRYIEAKAGQKFVVQVTFLPGFEFRFASHIQVASQVDQDGTRDTQSMAYEDVETIKGMLQKPQIRSISHRAFKDPATGMWYCYDFVFGALAVRKFFPILISAAVQTNRKQMTMSRHPKTCPPPKSI